MNHLTAPLAILAVASATGAQAQLAGSAASVQEVVVTGTRPLTETQIDRKVYSVSSDLQATTGTAAEVLNNVPSLTVDADGNVSLRGDPNVTILVDGKPSAQFAGATRGQSLQQFPASDIDRIEVLANPPAQYKAEGSGGVINIVTKKTRKPGLSGSGQLNVGDQRRYVFGLDGAYNSGRLKLAGGIGLRQDVKERLTRSSRTAVDPSTGLPVLSQQEIDEHFRRLMPSAKGSIDYDINDRQSVGVSFSHRELSGPRYFDQHNESGPPTGTPTGRSDRHSDGHEWNVEASRDLHFDQKLWRPNETLSLGLERSVTRERERYAYRNSFALPAKTPAFDDLYLSLDLVKTEATADYALPLSGDRDLKFGYDLERDRNAFDNTGDNRDPLTGQAIFNPAVSNHFRYRQDVNAAYGQYQTPLGRWTAQAGLRLEATDVSFLQVTGNIPGGRQDFGAYPSLHLTRSVGEEGKLSASVGRRVKRPDPESLNPFTDHQDIHNLRAGNPNLLPQETWAYELGYSGAAGSMSYGATFYLRSDRNSVTDVLRPLSGDVVLATKANLPKSRAAGLEFSANGKLGATLSYGVSGDLFNSQIDAAALGAAGLKSTTGLNLKANLNYQPTSIDTAQISISRSDKRLTPQGYLAAINLVNVGYKHQLQPDLSLVLTVSDLFDGQRQRRLITTSVLHDVYERHQLGRIAAVGIVYSFGAAKKGKPAAFEYDQ